MGLQMIRITPASPWQKAYVERVIGSNRRECTDHLIAVNAAHLSRILRSYIRYYNLSWTHLALGKDTPLRQPANTIASGGKIIAFSEVGGLHHRYERLAA